MVSIMIDKYFMAIALAPCCQICYIENRRGKARDIRPTLYNDYLMLYSISRSLVRVVGGYFLFPKIV